MNLDPPTAPAAAPRPRDTLLAFAIAAALFLALHAWRDVRQLWHDASIYWALADLPNYHAVANNIRGYLLAVLLAPARAVADATASIWSVRVWLSLTYAWALTWLVPGAFVALFGGRLTLARRLAPAVLMLVLLPGLLLYPLSDLPALLLMIGSLFALRTAQQRAAGGALPLRWLAGAGALAGAAYNTRTIYLFVLLALLLAVPLVLGRGRAWGRRSLETLVLAAAALLVMLPQGFINQHAHGKFTLDPAVRSAGTSLFLSQLHWGIALQRYETAVVEEKMSFGIRYEDPAGNKLWKKLDKRIPFDGIPGYLGAVADHPLDFLGVYARHFVNGLDLRDGLLYVHRLSETRTGIALFNFLVLALAAWVTVLRAGAGAASPPALWLGLWLLPVLLVVPGAIETRFFAPLHLLAWCAIAFHFDGRALAASFRQHRLALPAALLAAAGVFFAITLSTMASRVQP